MRTYNCSASRLRQRIQLSTYWGQLSNENNWVTTYYVRDAQGNVLTTYEKTYVLETNGSYSVHLKSIDNAIYGSSRLGLYKNTASDNIRNFTITGFTNHKFAGRVYTNVTPPTEQVCTALVCPKYYSSRTGLKQYELTDHLGNVQTVITDNNIGIDEGTDGFADYFRADLVNVTDYYPFGSEMPDRISGGRGYRYGFNGKENDNEVKGEGNQQDYGMRIYDPRLGKFLSVDPLTPKYPELTPYQFASNTPISAVDIDGLEANVDYTPSSVRAMKRDAEDPFGFKSLGKKAESKEEKDRHKVALKNLNDLAVVINTINGTLAFFPGASIAEFMARATGPEKYSTGVMLASFGWAVFDIGTFGGGSELKLIGTAFKYTKQTSAVVKFTGLAAKQTGKVKEIITVTNTGKLSTAIDVAKSIVGDLGDDAVKKIGKFGSQEGKNVGWQAADGSRGWRIDYSGETGAHINWWTENEKGAVLFKGAENFVNMIIDNEIIKALK